VQNLDYCVHFAAETHVSRSIENPGPFYSTNAIGTQNLLDVLRKYNLERFIYISTSEVYGTCEYVPMDENHPLNPRSPYSSSKCAADRLCSSYIDTYDYPITIIRPFNNYGTKQHPEKLIPHVITSMLQKIPARIFGDGEAKRDWLYVSDNIRGIFKALTTENANQKIINFATGKSYSVNEIISIIQQRLKGEIDHIEARGGEVSKMEGSYKFANELLGWEAKIDIKTGLNLTMDWYINNETWWKTKRIEFSIK